MNQTIIRAGLCAFLLTLCLSAEAQVNKGYRVGYLSPRPGIEFREDAFREGLLKLGYIEGRNVAIDWRFTKGKAELFPTLASDLVRRKVDCILAVGVNATQAASKATTTLPIVRGDADDDPVRRGLIASLARPGGNITGVISISSDLAGKRLELLKEIIPNLSRVGVLWDAEGPGAAGHVRDAELAATPLGLKLQSLGVRDAGDFENVFRAAAKARLQALTVVVTGLISNYRAEIVNLATRARLPLVASNPDFVLSGGVLSYAADIPELSRRAATYVDKILKGAKPAELPVEQPTKFELVINLKSAKQIGLTIPPNVLARA